MQFGDRVLMELWNIFGGEEVRPKNFTMDNARKFFYEKRMEFPQAKSCVLQVEPHGKNYEVVQLMLDSDMNIIKTDRDLCVGRKLIAENVSKDVFDFLEDKKWKIMEG